jgi:hypothetical protein
MNTISKIVASSLFLLLSACSVGNARPITREDFPVTFDRDEVCARLERCFLFLKKPVELATEMKNKCINSEMSELERQIQNSYVLNCQDLPDCDFIICMAAHQSAHDTAMQMSKMIIPQKKNEE